MGLKRLGGEREDYYMYYSVCEDQEQALHAVVLAGDEAYTVKVTSSNEDLQRWCVKLGRSSSEYLQQLCGAVGGPDTNAGLFELQDDHLVWKQYFPDQDIHGKKGKFRMEKVRYKEAVGQVLAGVVKDLQHSSSRLHTLSQEVQDSARRLDKALELADDSVQKKEEFEREIYSKCAALINAKKLRIHQLRSKHPSSSASGRSGCLARAMDEATAHKPAKRARKQQQQQQQQQEDSDGFNSDTDVDDPDEEMDTDEERSTQSTRSARLATVKPAEGVEGGTSNGRGREVSSKVKMPDSQELFNASLEAELYPPSAEPHTSGGGARGGDSGPRTSTAAPPPQLTRSKAARSPSETSLDPPKRNNDDEDVINAETQFSFASTLF